MRIETMAALSQGAEVAPWAYESAQLGPFDCLIGVHATGICYSDIHMIDNDWMMSRYPLVPGHEVVGEIAEVGSQVTHVKPGDRVGVGWQAGSCLLCGDCLKGNENLCNQSKWLIVEGYGGFASHLVVDSRFCFLLPSNLSSETAGPLLCGGTTVYSALRCAGMTSGQEIGVIGLGGLGHLAVQFAHKLGNRVTVFTTTAEKVEVAPRFGAHRAILVKNGQPTKKPDLPLDILISTVAHHLEWDSFLNLLASDGTLTFVGVPNDPMSVPLNTLLFKRRRIMASPIGGRATIQDMLGVADRLGIHPMVETFPLAEANTAIGKLRTNTIRYRAVLLPT